MCQQDRQYPHNNVEKTIIALFGQISLVCGGSLDVRSCYVAPHSGVVVTGQHHFIGLEF